MLRYLGRLYDHDPDNTKTMQNLHSILLGRNRDYDVDSMMREVRLLACRCLHIVLHLTYLSTFILLFLLHLLVLIFIILLLLYIIIPYTYMSSS
jgi:hypothetical protein